MNLNALQREIKLLTTERRQLRNEVKLQPMLVKYCLFSFKVFYEQTILIVILSVVSVERSSRAREFVGLIHDLVIPKDVINMVPA